MNEAKELKRLCEEYGCRKDDNRTFSRSVLKLCSDRIMLTDCYPRRIRFKRFNEDYKVNVETGELVPYDFSDCKRQARNLETSVSRAKRAIEDICAKNAFDFFVTVTFNRKYVDRYSAEPVRRLFACDMKRLRRKYGKVSFVAVAEYHADKAIHYHCFMTFERQPKLLYSREIKAYFFTDEFKKDDCFLVAEKVDKAPTGYLKKYINKNMERPLYRRFSCSRDLKRSKVLESVEVTDKAMAFKSAVLRRGFKLWTENKFARSFRYVVSDDGAGVDGARSAPPSPSADSSIHDINDRNEAMLRQVYDAILEEVRLLSALRRGENVEISNNGSTFKVGGKRQLSFLFD